MKTLNNISVAVMMAFAIAAPVQADNSAETRNLFETPGAKEE